MLAQNSKGSLCWIDNIFGMYGAAGVYGFTNILSIVQQNMFPHDVLELKKRVESKRRADDVTD